MTKDKDVVSANCSNRAALAPKNARQDTNRMGKGTPPIMIETMESVDPDGREELGDFEVRRLLGLYASFFALGRIVATPGALAALQRSGTPATFLHRHVCGDSATSAPKPPKGTKRFTQGFRLVELRARR